MTNEPVYVDMDIKYIEDERWDVLGQVVEVLGKDAPDQSLFVQSLAKACGPYMEPLEKPLQPANGHRIYMKMSGLTRAARADGRIYFKRVGNDVTIEL